MCSLCSSQTVPAKQLNTDAFPLSVLAHDVCSARKALSSLQTNFYVAKFYPGRTHAYLHRKSLQMKWWCSEAGRYYLNIIISLADLNEDPGYKKEKNRYCCPQGGVPGQRSRGSLHLGFSFHKPNPTEFKVLMPCWFLHETSPILREY